MAQGYRPHEEFESAASDAAQSSGAAGPARALPCADAGEDLDLFCETHIELASAAAIRRKKQMQRRLAFVQSLWNDPERFDAVVATGRYLKLCNLTEWISDFDARAWQRIKDEVLAVRDASGARSAA